MTEYEAIHQQCIMTGSNWFNDMMGIILGMLTMYVESSII